MTTCRVFTRCCLWTLAVALVCLARSSAAAVTTGFAERDITPAIGMEPPTAASISN